MPNAISIKDASKTFHVGGNSIPALRDIFTRDSQGGFVSLLGPSRLRQEHVLRLIGDLLESDEGSVQVLGKSAHDARTRTRLRHGVSTARPHGVAHNSKEC